MKIKHYTQYAQIEDPKSLIQMINAQMTAIEAKRHHKDLDDVLRKVLREGTRTVLFVMEDDSGPLGFSFCNICSGLESGGDYLWINEIFIQPPFRGKGLASILLGHMADWAKQAEMNFMSCVTDKTNAASQQLFKGQGFDLDPLIWMDKTIK